MHTLTINVGESVWIPLLLIGLAIWLAGRGKS